MVNTLTAEASLITGPVVLGTLVKHYLERLKRDASKKPTTQLRRDELLYDEAFNVIKKFLEVSTYHTVEEVQAFGNMATPSPPWVHVVKVVVPMSCCDDAAKYLTQVLGGEETARRLVGGVKWWQVRGIDGVKGEWITARKDWQEAKRRYKMQKQGDSPAPKVTEPAHYEEDMDDMRCILYLHGGGYFFGSVDQERYSIQRHARKINGRVFAMNYRLAPQYPFPCALQDVLASYLYLIRPPPEAKHRPVKPSHLIISGDSAGGGISLALLQVIRDLELPMPAGGVLISPWCDLTHSFPSVHTNTDTDVIPKYGLSLQKPSILWPPPSQEMTRRVHATLRSRIRKTLKMDDPTATIASQCHALNAPGSIQSTMPIDVGATASLPAVDSADRQTISLTTEAGETLKITEQLHMYTQNSLLIHPLVSPGLSYLGGLPPLFIIASDKEVLRDEIIYSAHKAAYPERFPLKDEIRNIYPPLKDIESRFKGTSVHLQVYDDTAHVIPVLFSFTTPGKYCFRAMASFIKHVTGMTQTPQSPVDSSFSIPSPPQTPIGQRSMSFSAPSLSRLFTTPPSEMTTDESTRSLTSSEPSAEAAPAKPDRRKSIRRSISQSVSALHRRKTVPHSKDVAPAVHQSNGTQREDSTSSSDVGGPRFGSPTPQDAEDKMAGDPAIYMESGSSWDGTMIRERISTKGVIRLLEPESELDAMKVPSAFIGSISELAIRRFIEGLDKFDRKFAHAIKVVEKHRHNNLERANKDIIKNMTVLQQTLEREEEGSSQPRIKEGLIPSSGSWSWAWALDGDENPPPSSIVSRRDTEEARRLAKIADHGIFEGEHTLTANNLWSVMVNFLTVSPDKDHEKEKEKDKRSGSQMRERKKSVFAKFMPTSLEKLKIEGLPEVSQPQSIKS
ncbi:alpha/beta-hydrolase [Hymenopellis radicata]|nr:alpha/beta-hydrolase [Hymenopellis radicata]